MKFRTIEYLRGLAALSVVVAHVDSSIRESASLGFGQWHSFAMPGTPGVEFFFVLSGFVMATAHRPELGSGGNPLTFLWKRFCRIYPLYWLALLVPIYRFWGAPSVHPEAIAAWASLLPIRTDNLIVVAWTLRQEVTFYLMLSLCLVPRIGRLILLSWVSGTIAFHFLIAVEPPAGVPGIVFSHVFNLFNFEFFAGLLAGWILPRVPRSVGLGCALLLGGVAGVAWRMALDGWGAEYGPLHARPIYGLSYAAIITACATLERDGALRIRHLWAIGAASAGAVSYPLYLSHLLTLDEVVPWLARHGIAGFVGVDVAAAAMLTASVAVATLLTVFVDRPLQHALRRLSVGSRSRRPVAE